MCGDHLGALVSNAGVVWLTRLYTDIERSALWSPLRRGSIVRTQWLRVELRCWYLRAVVRLLKIVLKAAAHTLGGAIPANTWRLCSVRLACSAAVPGSSRAQFL